MEGIQMLVQNLSSSYFLAVSTLIAASLVALFYGIKNAEEDEYIEKNGKRYRKKKPPAFYLPCSLNQECLFEDDEEEPAEEEKAPTSKAASAEEKIKSQLTPEELKKEQITQQIQLSEIYKLMQEQSEKFGVTSFEDVEDQLKMYRM